jgi:ribosomal protein S18 acetylase RimI-like enzyme
VSAFEIRKLTAEEWENVRALRLEALTLHPEAFSADLERDTAFAPELWRERLAAGRTFGAFVDGELAGMVAWIPGGSRKTAHTGEIGGMYLRESARGSGAAAALMEAALNDAAAQLQQITLTVNADNARAIRFYEKHGFRTVGRIPHSLCVNGRTYDELIMLRQVSTSD